jgi:hypothetical protein
MLFFLEVPPPPPPPPAQAVVANLDDDLDDLDFCEIEEDED